MTALVKMEYFAGYYGSTVVFSYRLAKRCPLFPTPPFEFEGGPNRCRLLQTSHSLCYQAILYYSTRGYLVLGYCHREARNVICERSRHPKRPS